MKILPSVRAVLETTPERWMALAARVPGDLMERRPAPQEWSPVECLLHMLDVEVLYGQRVEALLEGRDIPAFDPHAGGTQNVAGLSPVELAVVFSDLRQVTMELLGRLTTADLARQATHAELGPVLLEQLLYTWAAHDLNHTVQAERALIQPFIAGSGPWNRFFTAHALPPSE
ncbi:MAG TPA: DinB family protein [Roseiflexaceae bacterium]|nr:DinB family protein [Roseiflexaceae bacterium]